MLMRRGQIIFRKKQVLLIILFCIFLFSSILDARTYRKRRRVKPSNPTDILNKAIADNDKDVAGSYVEGRLNRKRKTRRYKRKSRHYKRKSKRYKKKKSSKKKHSVTKKISSDSTATAPLTIPVVPAISDEMKLQTSLLALGYYHGTIDGEVNSFETRKAIKTMNQAFGNGDTLFLDTQSKETLIYLADLYEFKKNLILNDTGENSRNIKLQTALKVLGFYHDEIDGLVGPGTRNSILQYKKANNMNKNDTLDFQEEHQLASKAADMTRQYIEEAKEGLIRDRSKPEKKKSMKENTNHTIKKEKDTHDIPISKKIQRPKSDIGLSDLFE